MGSSAEGVLAHFQPRICQTGRGHPHPKVTNATLGSDLKHRPAAGPPSSRAKPRDSQEEERGPNPCLSYSTRCPRCPLAPRELRGTAATPQGKGMRIHHPSLGTEQGTSGAARPGPSSTGPPGNRQPRPRPPSPGGPGLLGNSARDRAGAAAPDPNSSGTQGTAPVCFPGREKPNFPDFSYSLCGGDPTDPQYHLEGDKINKRKQEKGKKKKKRETKFSLFFPRQVKEGREGGRARRFERAEGDKLCPGFPAVAAGAGLCFATRACSNLRRSGTINRIIQRSGKAASLLLVSMTASERDKPTINSNS